MGNVLFTDIKHEFESAVFGVVSAYKRRGCGIIYARHYSDDLSITHIIDETLTDEMDTNELEYEDVTHIIKRLDEWPCTTNISNEHLGRMIGKTSGIVEIVYVNNDGYERVKIIHVGKYEQEIQIPFNTYKASLFSSRVIHMDVEN